MRCDTPHQSSVKLFVVKFLSITEKCPVGDTRYIAQYGPIWEDLSVAHVLAVRFSSGGEKLNRNVCTKGLPATSGVHQLCLGRPAQKSKLARAALLLDIEHFQHLVAVVVDNLHGDLARFGLIERATHSAVEALPRVFVNVSA